jgi:hypothetical protein
MADLDLIAFLGMIAAPATNSGLIVLLPLVGAVVGAIVGAGANSWYRNREEKKAQRRELRGLMTLVAAEHAHHYPTLRLLASEPSLVDARSVTNLQTAVWDDTKVKLALLLSTDRVVALVRYYDQIQSILDNLKDEEMPPERKRDIVTTNAEQAEKYSEEAFAYSGKSVFLDNLDGVEYAKDVLERWVRDAERIRNERPPERPEEGPDG